MEKKANKGEKIRIINKRSLVNPDYQNGDELTVTSYWFGGVWASTNDGIQISLNDDEYIITTEVFAKEVKCGGNTPYEGTGYYHDGEMK